MGAVKVGQRVAVGGKVDRHKVHDDADAHPVAGVDKGCKVGRGAVAAGHGEIAGGLVAPAAVEGMLGQRQQLHMGEAVVQQPGDQLPRQLAVVVPAVRAVLAGGVGLVLPAARVELVDVQGQVAALVPPLHPGVVVEREVQFGQDAGRAGAQFGGKGVGVGPHHGAAVPPVDAELVHLALLQTGDEAVPDAGFGPLHGHTGAPAVKAAADLHGHGAGGPHREPPAVPEGMCTQRAVGVKAVAQKERTIDRRKFHAKNSFSIHSPALSAIASQCRLPQVGGCGSPCRREAA